MDILKVSNAAAEYHVNLDDQVDGVLSRRSFRGSRALVYQGSARSTGQRVAIKTFYFGPPSDDRSMNRVLREVNAWSKLCHENIVRVFGVTTKFDHTMSLVTEWVDMGSAIDFVQNPAVDPCPLLIDVARGLSYLHGQQKPIIHGDLRGKNILISRDNRALITDYGVGILVDSVFDNNVAVSSFGGASIRSMSPDSLQSYGELTMKDDIWAYGMLILELLTRKPPFHDIPGLEAVLSRIMQGTPNRPSVKDTCGRLTDAWWNVAYSCWHREPSCRPSILEVFKGLSTLACTHIV